ncbi:hypothetical protein ACHAWU_003494 [Discostella pseudostelligera]|uniref:Uncharacterized protein n=1 Tax=Discostella pseudostelligera TaxID=259834 RepID=A0ABD3LYB4_9STRA
MPLPSSKTISRKLGNVGFTTSWSTVEELKLQHAEELARQQEEHAKRVESLETEIGQCRTEIDALKALSDEHVDTLMPLPSPAKSLKFVKNTTTRKARKGAAPMGNNGKQIENIISEMKQQHRKDLAKAAEIYAKKLYSLKKEAEKYKALAEATRAKDASAGVCDGNGVNLKTGVAQNDKENISRKQSLHNESNDSSKLTKIHADSVLPTEDINPTPHHATSKGTTLKCTDKQFPGPMKSSESLNGLDVLKDPYERLFLKEYEFNNDTIIDEALGKTICVNTSEGVNPEEIDALCTDLMDFMKDVKSKSLDSR